MRDGFRGRLRRLLLVVVGLALACPSSVHAQRDDSSAAIGRARDAQRRFETVRRMHLPLVQGRGRSGCDAVIGPFCYWYDAAEADRPPEQPRVTAARGALLQVLDSLGGRWPRLDVIAGNRVRYRVDGADTSGAVLVATAGCDATPWWCSALAGFARHVAGDFGGAAAAFDDALARMPRAKRCEWADLSALLPGTERRRFARLTCEAREREGRRVWWLATPLLARDANDFLTEYLARRVAAELEAADPVMFGQRWNRHAEEMLLRFGRQEWWTRERPSAIASTASPHLVGHELVPSFSFVPAERLLRDSTRLPAPEDWELDAKLPASRYAPAYARAWTTLDAQVARFRRGDSLLVVAAFDAPATTRAGATATLALSPGPGAPTLRSAPVTASAAGTARVLAPGLAPGAVALVSLEVIDTVARTVARHRVGIRPIPTQRIAVSDLLLHRAAPRRGAGAPAFGDVVSGALPGRTIRTGDVGIYWETYDAGAGGGRTLTLTVERTDRSLLARAATRLGVAEEPQPVRIRWRDAAEAGSITDPRSITVSLRDLPEGDYLIRLTVERDDGASTASTRPIVIAR